MTELRKFTRGIFVSLLTIAAATGMTRPVEAAVEGWSGNGDMTETFSANYGSHNSPLVGGDSDELSLSDFNPSLGSLTGVTITLISNDTIESEVINLIGHCQDYKDATATLPVSVTALAGLTTTTTGVAGPYSGMVRGHQYTESVAGKSHVTTTSSADIDPSDFILYEGAGQSFNLDVQVGDGVYSGSSAGNAVAFFGTGDSYGTVEVTYDYSCVPEPGTLAAGLGILGFCGINLVRRARV
ncbi:MAG: choice-of-anchor E domain-containing protein [Verrucomicrobiota bacterium]